MINGEGAEEKPSSAVSSPCDPPCDGESDGGDDLSNYSSCGGESDFERYCSASSAMGTPSFRGSSFQDSEFGPFRGVRLGGENTTLKNSGAERVLSDYPECKYGSGSGRGGEFYCDGKDNEMLNLNGKMENFVVSAVDNRGNVDDGYCVHERIENENNGNGQRSERISGEFGESGKCYRSVEKRGDKGEDLNIDEVEDRNLSDEGEASSRYAHSEGEDSMFGCGSDDERKIDLYYGKNVLLHDGESRKKENQLVMNSAVAFGSDDWDDFVQESRENPFSSIGWDGIPSERQTRVQNGNSVTCPDLSFEEKQNEVGSNPTACNQVEAPGKLAGKNVNALSMNSTTTSLVNFDAQSGEAKVELASRNQDSDIDELAEYLGCSSGFNVFQTKMNPPKEETPANKELEVGKTESEMSNQDMTIREVMAIQHNIVLKDTDLEETNMESDPLSEAVVNHHHVVPAKDKEDKEDKLFEDNNSFVSSSLADTTMSATTKKNFSLAFYQIEDHFVPVKARDFELNDFYDEIVNDMEDILLDTGESSGSRFAHGTRIYQSHFARPSRDGGSSASTSGTDYAYTWIQQPRKIDGIEVVGTRQKKGDVSFSERLVGVQKYTVYIIRVWSGEDQWEVERRYRDFNTLFHRLKKLFANHGWTLPSPWLSVERESRKLFGNASPNVVADRSVLIQDCLQSVIHPKFLPVALNALICFLSPSETVPDSPASDTSVSQSSLLKRGTQVEDISTLGKTISLIVQIRPLKSMKQIIDAQHYRCAGCHRNFDDGKTRVQEFVQALGWGKPRLCEYSGQLFCSSCHSNDTAVLPARVLHSWDFTRYPVSQMAKSFLDSINDQPMLCVSAINPFLFSKVPTLQHVANIRNRIRALLPYVRCPFRRSIYTGLGSRKYLLESNDFFALKDLIDLSKGVFSALPVMVETVSRKIQEHITEQCLVCYDVGVPCSARQDCNNPLSLIFPFQEGEVEKCRSCELVFHKNCFQKIASCSCGARFKPEETKQRANEGIHCVNSNSNLLGGTTESSSGLLAGLFAKVMPGRSQNLRLQEPKGGEDNVILMGSLPNTFL